MNLESYINEAFDLYFEELKKNDYILSFLKEHNSLNFEKLKKRKIKVIIDALENSSKDTFLMFRELGKRHYVMGLPYVEFLEAFDKIRCHLNRILLKKNLLDVRLYTKFSKFFQKSKNFSALGYLDGYIEHDYEMLKLLYEKEKDSAITKNFIKSHILWLLAILNDIKKLKKESSVSLKYDKCEFSWFLKDTKFKALIDEDEKSIIDYLHKLTHSNAEDIYYQIRKEDYTKLLHSYVSLVRNSLALLNLLALLVIQENIIEIKIDPLTGLLNRRAMNEILEHNLKIAQIAEEPFTVAMVDIDNFKEVNDKFGHLIGDCALKHFSNILKKSLRKSDFVFRYGGEEFLILLPSTKLDDAVSVLEKLRKIIQNTEIECNNCKIKLTVSIGVESIIPDENTDIQYVISLADKKLYEAKKTGKNKVVY